ncbi:hypothetical protein [Pseudalkalibacillus sp. SCS-8]
MMPFHLFILVMKKVRNKERNLEKLQHQQRVEAIMEEARHKSAYYINMM